MQIVQLNVMLNTNTNPFGCVFSFSFFYFYFLINKNIIMKLSRKLGCERKNCQNVKMTSDGQTWPFYFEK